MSEAAQLARVAREHLAAALKALQSNTNVPPELLEVAEPIAEAMSVLHRVERTEGANLDGRELALANVRAALEKIQKVPTHHPATEVVMEAVASSLSKVHALTRYVPPMQAPAYATPPRPTPQPIPAPRAAQQVPIAPAPQQACKPPPQQQTDQPPPQQQQQAPVAHAQPAPPRDALTTVPATPTAGRIDVELGIHSTSNFYKGLGGNDVIEAGGIFVATYKVPKIGATVNLRVLLPGDYEFNAVAVVQWTRAAGDVSDPGFGARFTQITPEGRQLVYRYARNREPMFYDDL